MPRQMADQARPQRGGRAPRRRGLPSTSGWAAGRERDRDARHAASGWLRLLALVVLLTAAFSLLHALRTGFCASREAVPLPSPVAASPSPAGAPTSLPARSSQETGVTPVPTVPLPIGIVAGHWGSDSGAICDGWLREVDVNLAIAQRVVQALRAQGYPTDLLEEFDPRLEGYRARALVSIHADSCLYPEASGFKVARVEDSAVPDVEDELVECLVRRYQARTGLPFHEGSITPDMTHYHTFYEIDPNTPGAIIEVGFMLADRDLLLHQQDLVAQGIVDGILCFVREEAP
ncbi:MAG TPA: N-acetylmuramoyl-L-alanine amidase [Chloroflexi bacterium]|nr:N-acetylmuramoyl-L-alanine amidase [Chloroflexota bacterium]